MPSYTGNTHFLCSSVASLSGKIYAISISYHLSGAVCIPTFLPLTVLFLISVNQSPEASVLQWPPSLPSTDQLWDPLAAVLLLGWITLHALLYLMPLGKVWHVHQPVV